MGNKSTLIKFMVVIGAALTLVGCSASEEAPKEVKKTIVVGGARRLSAISL